MAAFEYQALDQNGKTRRGVAQGDTAKQVRQSLRDQGLAPLQVDAVTDSGTAAGSSQRNRISTTERALFMRQLASLLSSGLPLDEALGIVADQVEKASVKRVVAALRARIGEGHTLATAMNGFPRAFTEMECATVEAGEHSGRLDQVLTRLADHTEQRDEVSRQANLALLYPAILSLVAIAVVAGLMTWVVPKVTSVFIDMDVALPKLTLALLALSALAQRWLLPVLLLLIIVGVIGVIALRNPAARTRWHRWLLRLPIIGRILRGSEAARLARTLQIMSASGVPLLDGLAISGKVMRLLPLRAAVEQATSRVREGEPLARALRSSGLFPPILVRLIDSGEQSGQLEPMLASAADTQEREVRTSVAVFLEILQPLLILAVGVVILLIVLAILLPIFQLNQLIQ